MQLKETDTPEFLKKHCTLTTQGLKFMVS